MPAVFQCALSEAQVVAALHLARLQPGESSRLPKSNAAADPEFLRKTNVLDAGSNQVLENAATAFRLAANPVRNRCANAILFIEWEHASERDPKVTLTLTGAIAAKRCMRKAVQRGLTQVERASAES